MLKDLKLVLAQRKTNIFDGVLRPLRYVLCERARKLRAVQGLFRHEFGLKVHH